MSPGAKRAAWIAGLAAVAGGGVLLATKPASAATPQGPPPTPYAPSGWPNGWRNATDADVAADKVGLRYQQLLAQPVGTSVVETYNGRVWALIVCPNGQCIPPSTFDKDVRGFVRTA